MLVKENIKIVWQKRKFNLFHIQRRNALNTGVLLVALVLILMFLGVPIGISLCLPLFLILLVEPVTTPYYLLSMFFSGIAKFTLLSVPFFILAGAIMEKGGISKRLIRFANSLVGNVTGSLGAVAILSCMFFGAVSGSATATVAAIGSVLLPEMVRAGYDKVYAVALVAAAGGLGVVIPPSFPMLVYCTTNNVSVGDMFIAGFGPGFLIGATLIIINYFYSKKMGYTEERKISLNEIKASFIDGVPALFMPVIILGGIYGGIFTVTEAAVVATVYGILVSLFIYKEVSLKELLNLYRQNAIFLGSVMLMLAVSPGLGRMFSYLGINTAIQNFFLNFEGNYLLIFLIVFVIIFIAGMLLDATPMIIILSPILLPVLSSFGMHPIHFGIVMIAGLAIAFITPPVACNLFTASSMTGISVNKIASKIVYFLIGLIICFFILFFVPQISLFLIS